MAQHAFQAEVAQVLDLVIHSLYRNKEIFLRELVSNASDALDKYRFEALTNDALDASDELEIRLTTNVEEGTLTIWDSGIGMTQDELVTNLGTIAHSGTKKFLQQIKDSDKGVELIGQFGVGFYSAFLVADQVDVISRAAGSEDAFKWTSDAKTGFDVMPWGRDAHGTTIVLHLKDEAKDYLGSYTLRNLVSRYSDYVSHPIKLAVEKPVEKAEEEGDDDVIDATEPETETVYEVINQQGALWQRSPDDITDDQYEEFYKHLTHDWEAPLARNHFKIEGGQLFTGLLYVPARPPFDLFDRDAKHGVRLFVKRVFIMDDAEELLPIWLRFVRGVVDSDDLPLNVSRDVLQDSGAARVIKKQLVKKALDMIEGIAKADADNTGDYESFWNTFGKVLKEGLHYDDSARKRVAKLVRFESSGAEGLTSFEQYVERMPEGQTAIYYAIGSTRQLVENSPHTEALRAKGYEVIYFTDTVDQWAIDGLKEFDEKQLVSAAQADLDLEEDADEETKKATEERTEALKPLTDKFAEVLEGKVAEVRVSTRLAGSPVCLVVPQGGLPSHIERMLRAQNDSLPPVKRILEINPKHPIIASLEGRDGDERNEFIELLYDQALLVEGSPIEDPGTFAARMTKLMTNALA